MTQNIYNNDAFFSGQHQLPRSVGGLDSAPGWPAQRAMLPDVQSKQVPDLGCGYGWFCRWPPSARVYNRAASWCFPSNSRSSWRQA